jgi:hypothetical protein
MFVLICLRATGLTSAAEKRARDAARKRADRARLTDDEAKVIRDREAAARRQQRAAQSPAQAASPKLRTRPCRRGSVRPSPPLKQPRPMLATPRENLGHVNPAKAILCRLCLLTCLPTPSCTSSRAIAAQELFWARTYNWLFEPWRDADFGEMSEETATELKAAMCSECEVGAGDIERVMAAYYARRDPIQSPRSCGSCRMMVDTPIDEALPAGAPRAWKAFARCGCLTSLLFTDAPVPSHVPGREFAWPVRAVRGRATGRAFHPQRTS